MNTNIQIIHGDGRDELDKLEEESVELIITDPPYFLDGLDSDWNKGDKADIKGIVKGLPKGMKFDPKQGEKLKGFMININNKLIRCLKPGGYALLFSQPRLSHEMAYSLGGVGFEI